MTVAVPKPEQSQSQSQSPFLVWRGEEVLGGYTLRSGSGRKRPNSLRA